MYTEEQIMTDRVYYSSEAEQQARRERLVMAMLVAGLSLSVGAVIALLFAPQSGEKTRHQIGEQVDQVATNVQKNTDQVVKKVRDDLEQRLQNVRS
jgi:hypothetical protein